MPGARALAVAAIAATAMVAPAVAAAETVLKSKMTGAQIVNPDGGAPRGTADAILRVDPVRGRVCFEISYAGLGGKAVSGYLRRGAEGDTAMPLATLFASRAASPVAGCVRGVRERALRRVAEDPAGHYVDLSTRKFSKGAVRGQLRSSTRSVGGPPSGGSGPGRR